MSIDWQWHSRFLDMAALVATWSKDPSTKVGAVIVDDLRRVVGVGYNGFPRGISDLNSRLTDRDRKLRLTVHAEINAILNTTIPLKGCTLYSTFCPCINCAKTIIQSGIYTLVYDVGSPEQEERWKDEREFALQLFDEAGLFTYHR